MKHKSENSLLHQKCVPFLPTCFLDSLHASFVVSVRHNIKLCSGEDYCHGRWAIIQLSLSVLVCVVQSVSKVFYETVDKF